MLAADSRPSNIGISYLKLPMNINCTFRFGFGHSSVITAECAWRSDASEKASWKSAELTHERFSSRSNEPVNSDSTVSSGVREPKDLVCIIDKKELKTVSSPYSGTTIVCKVFRLQHLKCIVAVRCFECFRPGNAYQVGSLWVAPHIV